MLGAVVYRASIMHAESNQYEKSKENSRLLDTSSDEQEIDSYSEDLILSGKIKDNIKVV